MSQTKPVVFFSHSAKDKEMISEINKLVNMKTSETIKIFQSSDGESIPFGNNWVHTIEEGLKKAKIMFVFISPNSKKSSWIYFESGFSYSKEIKVIPVGIQGLKVEDLNPPLSLLQGFNINNYEGLNNIVAIINKEFDNNFSLDFNEKDYERLIRLEGTWEYIDDDISRQIDNIAVSLPSEMKGLTLNEESYNIITRYLKSESIHYYSNNPSKISLAGMEIQISKEPKSSHRKIIFLMDYIGLEVNMKIVCDLLTLLYEKSPEVYWLRIYFIQDIHLITSNFKVSARLNEFGIRMSERNEKLYEFKDLLFALDSDKDFIYSNIEKESLRVIYKPISFNSVEILELIHFLKSIKLIYSV